MANLSARLKAELGRALRYVDGAPDITGLPCDALTEYGTDYMRRYYLRNSKYESVRLHHIIRSDPGTTLHDHPWDYATALVKGGYTEVTPAGAVRYEAPCILLRQAEQAHRLVLDGDMWTFIVCGRVRRRWGFHSDGGWVPWRQYPSGVSVAGCQPSAEQPSRSW